MKFTETSLSGVYLIDIEPIGDSRGFFSRFWCSKEFEAQGLSFEVAQINVSHNAEAGTMRGLHYQRNHMPRPRSLPARAAAFSMSRWT